MRPHPIIIEDTREQTPWAFSSEVQVIRGAIRSGDYGIVAPDVEQYVTRRRQPRKRDAAPPAYPVLYAEEVIHDELAAVCPRADGTFARVLLLGTRLLRKSLPDLVSCVVGENRERFERELVRHQETGRAAAIVVEAPLSAARAGTYRSLVVPASVIGSTIAWHQRHGIPTVWCDDAREAARWAERWLTMALEQHIEAERARVVEKGHRAMVAADHRTGT